MSDFLQQMAEHSAERAAALGRFADSAFDKPLVPLRLGGFDVIAEIKDRSPAEGELAAAGADKAARARLYAGAGAAAISVLTEPSRFSGSLTHLREAVAAAGDVPVMRKDFLVDPVQVDEARAAGASGVLLIVTMLDDPTLRSMLDCAEAHGMFVLLESFGGEDLDRLQTVLLARDHDRAEAGELLYGLNTRNLRTLEVDAERLTRLAGALPVGPRVAESGIGGADDAARAATLGYTAALVGTALMRSDDPAGLVRAMKKAARGALAA